MAVSSPASSASALSLGPGAFSLQPLAGKTSSRTSLQCKRRHGGFVRCDASDDSRAHPWNAPDFVKVLGQKVWGGGLPPGALVGIVREVWNTGWLTMMGQLAPSGNDREFKRSKSQFRSRSIESARSGRYHLYVALTCPWAHRCAIVHVLKGLEDAVPLSIAVPGPTGLWEFHPQSLANPEGRLIPTGDRANGQKRLVDVYQSQKGGYKGRSTVPMLWDAHQKEVVNNESADIIEILNSDFNDLARNPGLDLAPSHLKVDIDRWNEVIYPDVNNGVYRCGFAQGQKAYDMAVESLFATLDMLDQHLATSRYLCGDSLTLADVRLFTTLFRFDPVYQILFKCSKQKLSEYHNLYDYMRDIYQVPKIALTCDLQVILQGYYGVLFPLNPGGICPSMPRDVDESALLRPHGRNSLVLV